MNNTGDHDEKEPTTPHTTAQESDGGATSAPGAPYRTIKAVHDHAGGRENAPRSCDARGGQCE
jgi:hypothetical protein